MGRVIAFVSIFPIGVGTSLSKWVKIAVKELKQHPDLRVQITPMGTILEADEIRTILDALKIAHTAVEKTGVQRISTTLKIDFRTDKDRQMEDKVRALESDDYVS
ncbi:MAG: MTH1187 family thiamine-binding protein [Promethearchaeota archaeon]